MVYINDYRYYVVIDGFLSLSLKDRTEENLISNIMHGTGMSDWQCHLLKCECYLYNDRYGGGGGGRWRGERYYEGR